jgi:GNAT superfamily N-acetyltransferase
VHIRTATPADLPALLDLLAQLNETPQPLSDAHRKAFDDVAADPRQRLFVVEDDGGALVAAATLVVIPNLGHGGRPWAIVENVVVDEPARGRGIGEMLMAHIIEQARAAGCYKVALTSRKFRTGAHRFYERLGFERTSEGFRYTLIPD